MNKIERDIDVYEISYEEYKKALKTKPLLKGE